MKSLERFYRSARAKDGYKARCKDCDRTAPKSTEAAARYRDRNRASLAERSRNWRIEHPERARDTNYRYRTTNPDRMCALWAFRRASKAQRTPRWLSKYHKDQIKAVYKEAREQGLVVDHIIPLNGKHVSGLHVPWNLQLLTAAANLRKSNTYSPWYCHRTALHLA